MSRARRRDRRVYLRGHPVLFALLAATRRRPVRRVGGTVLVHGADAYREALTRVPLDRTAPGTTGGAARALSSGGELLFDQEGGAHRAARRTLAEALGAAGVARLRPVWRAVLTRRLAPLAHGGSVDLVTVARELAGVTTCALLDCPAEPMELADAAAETAAATVREHLPVPRPGARRRARAARRAAARLEALVRGADGAADGDATGTDDAALGAMLAVAAVNTTVAALPRSAALCADGGLWAQAATERLRPALVAELLRVTAASPLLPRTAASDAVVDGCPVRAGDRLLLVARHAAEAHRRGPDAGHPLPASVAQLVFGAGPHACPGARLAKAQLDDLLAALAPHRPVVVRARADGGAALPGWRTLVVRAGRARKGANGGDGGPRTAGGCGREAGR